MILYTGCQNALLSSANNLWRGTRLLNLISVIFYCVSMDAYNLLLCGHLQTLVDIITEKQSINAANTCDELHFHMDQIYYESPPGLLMLHCIRLGIRHVLARYYT